jgi:acyl-CoA dehydrogenase
MNGFDASDIALIEEMAKRFAESEVRPYLEAWEEACEFPRELYGTLAGMGWLGMGYPEELGGTPTPWAIKNALSIALARHTGSGGIHGRRLQPHHRPAPHIAARQRCAEAA